MPNVRRPGWVVSSFTVPAELLTAFVIVMARRSKLAHPRPPMPAEVAHDRAA